MKKRSTRLSRATVPVWRPATPCYRAEIPLDLPPAAQFMYRQTNNMEDWYGRPTVFCPDSSDGTYHSQDVVVVGCVETRQFILAGALAARRSMTFFDVVKRGYNMTAVIMTQPDIRPGERPEPTVILRGPDWRRLLIQYAGLVVRENGVKPIRTQPTLAGYCSWYYWYGEVSEANFFQSVDSLAKGSATFARGVAQIDAGYFTHDGDWLDRNERWPSDFPEIAARIRSLGMRPGIWIAPLLARPGCELLKRHPDWFVRNPDGSLAIPRQGFIVLDTTLPAVRRHVADVMRAFYKMGFTYFKMDFLTCALMPGVRHDPRATPVSAFRLGMKTIREAVPKALLLGCTAPYLPCLGFIDTSRSSADARATRASVLQSYHDTISHWWMFDRYFRADPDAIIVRTDRGDQSLGDSRLSAIGAVLTGVCITSDLYGTLPPDRRALLERAATLRLLRPVPHDWPVDGTPSAFTGATPDGRKAAALVNDTALPRVIKFADLGLGDKVTELLQPLGALAGSLTLPPFDAAFVVSEK